MSSSTTPESESSALVHAIQTGKAKYVQRLTRNKTVYVVRIDSELLRVIYNSQRKQIAEIIRPGDELKYLTK